jgi:ABC-type multidrug transport system ATPase subunit
VNLPTLPVERQVTITAKGEKTKQILTDINITLKPGTVTALISPSGASKSTLLDVLSGRVAGKVSFCLGFCWFVPQMSTTLLDPQVDGDILVNDKPLNVKEFKLVANFIPQDDILFAVLTYVLRQLWSCFTHCVLLSLPLCVHGW